MSGQSEDSQKEENRLLRTEGLFNPEYVWGIIKRREVYENKIKWSTITEVEMRNYIESEYMILRKISSKIKSNPENESYRKIEKIVIRRINYLFELVIQKLPEAYEFYFAYFQFCQKHDTNEKAKSIILYALKFNSYNLEVWLVAGDYFVNDLKDHEMATVLLNKALPLFKDSTKLHLLILKNELMKLDKTLRETSGSKSTEGESSIISGVNLRDLDNWFESVQENIPDYEILLEALKLTTLYVFAKPVTEKIVQKLRLHYCCEVDVGIALAQYFMKNNNLKKALDIIIKCRNYKDNGADSLLCEEFIKIKLSIVKSTDMESNICKGKLKEQCCKDLETVVMLICQTGDLPLLVRIYESVMDCKFAKSLQDILIKKLSNDFSDNEIVWSSYARCQIENLPTLDAVEAIRKMVNVHRHSAVLYKNLIRLELSLVSYRDYIEEREHAAEQEIQTNKENECCSKIKIYMAMAFENVNDHNFILNVLDILAPHPFTEHVQQFIIHRLIKLYCNEIVIWDYLAEREKYNACKTITRASLYKMVNMFEKGLSQVSEQQRLQLWKVYLDNLLAIMEEDENYCSDSLTKAVKIKTVKTAFEVAAEQKCLTEDYYHIWVNLLENDTQNCLKILENGTSQYPKSLKVWKLRMKHAIYTLNEDLIKAIFKEGVLSLREDSSDLWCIIISYYTLEGKNDVIESIYNDALQQPEKVANALKPMYLEWLAEAKDVQTVRKTYKALAARKPFLKALHKTMQAIESAQFEPDFKSWESSHKLACKQFGETDVDVWVDYVMFFMRKSDGDKLKLVRRMAQEKLKPHLQDYFKDKYDEIIEKHS